MHAFHTVTGTPSVDPPGSAQLHLPPVGLTHCIRGVMVRDTRGLQQSAEGHYNYWPATPHCGISWMLSGELYGVDDAAGDGLLPIGTGPRVQFEAPILFGGCTTRPLVSWNPGAAHGVLLVFLPDALQALCGIEPELWKDRFAPAEEVFDAEWMDWCRAVAAAKDEATRLQTIEQFLQPRWKAARSGASTARHWVEDWVQTLLLRAGTSAPGRSLRQLERRIKRWTGQPLRELRGLGRAERAFFEAIEADERGDLNWAHLAHEAGYADQSHLCRQTRRITGFPPDELMRRMAQDEGLWPYRLWGCSDAQFAPER